MVPTQSRKAFIYHILEDRPHLEPVFHSGYGLPEQITKLDPNAFVVYNKDRDYFELHSLESYLPQVEQVTTMQMVLPTLEPKMLEKIILGSHIYHGYNIHDDMHRSEDIHKRSMDEMRRQSMNRSIKSTIDDISGRTKVY